MGPELTERDVAEYQDCVQPAGDAIDDAMRKFTGARIDDLGRSKVVYWPGLPSVPPQ